MPLIAFVVRVAFFLIVVRLLASFVAGVLRGYRGDPAPRRPRATGATELVRDRICNTFVPRDRALVASVAGREERFCSAACRDKAVLEARRAS
jgi:hypothetical protein